MNWKWWKATTTTMQRIINHEQFFGLNSIFNFSLEKFHLIANKWMSNVFHNKNKRMCARDSSKVNISQYYFRSIYSKPSVLWFNQPFLTRRKFFSCVSTLVSVYSHTCWTFGKIKWSKKRRRIFHSEILLSPQRELNTINSLFLLSFICMYTYQMISW